MPLITEAAVKAGNHSSCAQATTGTQNVLPKAPSWSYRAKSVAHEEGVDQKSLLGNQSLHFRLYCANP